MCGYVNAKNSYGGYVGETPFIGTFIGHDNSGFMVSYMGGPDKDTYAVLVVCRSNGLKLE